MVTYIMSLELIVIGLFFVNNCLKKLSGAKILRNINMFDYKLQRKKYSLCYVPHPILLNIIGSSFVTVGIFFMVICFVPLIM